MAPRPESGTLTDRVARLAWDRSRRHAALVVVAYLSGILGVAVAFLGGIDRPTEPLAAVGISLLFVSFACLFYLSAATVSLDAR